MNTVCLERIKFAVNYYLGDDAYLLDDIFIQEMGNFIANEIVVQARGHVLGDRQEEERVLIEYPRDWWQAFKERWFPSFLLIRWPVLYTRHEITPVVLYPYLDIKLPKEEHRVVLDSRVVYRDESEAGAKP